MSLSPSFALAETPTEPNRDTRNLTLVASHLAGDGTMSSCRADTHEIGRTMQRTIVPFSPLGIPSLGPVDRPQLLHELARAIDCDELTLVYQPRIASATGRLTGAEALLRWHSARFDCVAPDVFIPLAEQAGLIIPMGSWVLHEACRELRRWNECGVTTARVSVNVSMHQLQGGTLERDVLAAIRDADISPRSLELELTESAVMCDAQGAIEVLTRLRGLGIRIALDDFGTGHSCLAYLKRLPIDTLKIDKEFAADIGRSSVADTLLAAVIAMAHSLGLEVVAEGVETAEQLDFLVAHHCDEVQGFYCSPPLVAEEYRKFMLAPLGCEAGSGGCG